MKINDNIKIAFCFDDNLTKQICVTIASLLDASLNSGYHYDIYCICSNGAECITPKLTKIKNKRDKLSNLYVIPIQNSFENGYNIRNITSGTYIRLQLHNILPDINKIIYCDVDVLFRNNLSNLWSLELNNNILLGARGAVNLNKTWEYNLKKLNYWSNFAKNDYINAGVVLMNLREIRQGNLDKLWKVMYQEPYFYVDQDILNLTCKGKIDYFPLKYNLPAYLNSEQIKEMVNDGVYEKLEAQEAISNPVIIHYAGDKPWNNPNILQGDVWLAYINAHKDLRKIFQKQNKNNNLFMIKKDVFESFNRITIKIFGISIKFKFKK